MTIPKRPYKWLRVSTWLPGCKYRCSVCGETMILDGQIFFNPYDFEHSCTEK